ncbi:MAG: serine/threonine-protein kinase [Gemmatimonadales bacterium]
MAPPVEDDALLERLRMVFSGEYEVEQELARGGMAVVFKATEVALQRLVALKVLPPDLGITVHAVERFKREARMAAELDHPNIIPVYRVGQVGGILHIVMKFIEGRALDAMVEAQGALPVPVVLAVLRAATRALAFAHERDIIHRDVKSANILVDTDGRVMVSDFGIALRASDATLTAVGTLIGTPAFMSPEQCAGRRAGPQSDQYSLGIVAFQMLTGAVPFETETLAGILQHHLLTPVPDVSAVRDDVPAALVQVVTRALAKDPAERFPTTGAMLAAIECIPFTEADRRGSERILRELAGGASRPKLHTRSLPPLADAHTLSLALFRAQRPWRRQRALAFAAAGAVLILGGAAWWALREGRAALGPEQQAPLPPPVDSAGRAAVASSLSAPSSPVSPPPRVAVGRLRVLTTPGDAEILVDGRRVGIGSLVDLPVAAGSRRLQVRAAGYRTFDTTLVVQADSTLWLGRITLQEGGGRP